MAAKPLSDQQFNSAVNKRQVCGKENFNPFIKAPKLNNSAVYTPDDEPSITKMAPRVAFAMEDAMSQGDVDMDSSEYWKKKFSKLRSTVIEQNHPTAMLPRTAVTNCRAPPALNQGHHGQIIPAPKECNVVVDSRATASEPPKFVQLADGTFMQIQSAPVQGAAAPIVNKTVNISGAQAQQHMPPPNWHQPSYYG